MRVLNVQTPNGYILRLAETPNGSVDLEIDRVIGLQNEKQERVQAVKCIVPADRREIVAGFFQK